MISRERMKTWYPYAEELLSNEIYVLVSAIAMNALLAFFPFVILLVSISTKYFPGWKVHTMTYEILAQYLPANQTFIIRTLQGLALGFGRVQVVSLVVLIWSIANVFIPLEMALNRAWGVTESRTFWRSQGLAVVMSSLSGLLAFSFVAGAAFTQDRIGRWIPADWGATQAAIQFINVKLWMVPLTLMMFFVTFYIVPNTVVVWRNVLPAAVFTGLLWEISNYVFMWVLPYLGLGEIYGGFVVTVTLMTWAYVSGIILVFGANLLAKSALPSLTAPLFSVSRASSDGQSTGSGLC
jgi:membrane protein